MRLLHTRTLQIEDFVGSVPPYVILSHRWGMGEVTFQDMQNGRPERMAGYSKICGCCAQAAQDGFQYVWIDTCCVDKTSSAELSEAINCMYKWYRDSALCYVYLRDVPSDCTAEALRNSEWFTRSWTLQELVAPSTVEFYSLDWIELGTKSSLAWIIADITQIDLEVLQGEYSLFTCSVAQRMRWASSRQATKLEDKAYSLLGLFDVNMPLLYGEGDKAFRRLQEEIANSTQDPSIFAWCSMVPYQAGRQDLFAPSPACFGCKEHIPIHRNNDQIKTVTSWQKNPVDQIIGIRGGSITLKLPTLDQYVTLLRLPPNNLLVWTFCAAWKGDLICLPLSRDSVKDKYTRSSDHIRLVPSFHISNLVWREATIKRLTEVYQAGSSSLALFLSLPDTEEWACGVYPCLPHDGQIQARQEGQIPARPGGQIQEPTPSSIIEAQRHVSLSHIVVLRPRQDVGSVFIVPILYASWEGRRNSGRLLLKILSLPEALIAIQYPRQVDSRNLPNDLFPDIFKGIEHLAIDKAVADRDSKAFLSHNCEKWLHVSLRLQCPKPDQSGDCKKECRVLRKHYSLVACVGESRPLFT